MEAGKKRLADDTAREANSAEVKGLLDPHKLQVFDFAQPWFILDRPLPFGYLTKATGMTEHHQHALPKGYRLGRYSIESVLGAGGFGITYLARHTGLNQKVAIKEYLPDDFGLRIEGKKTVRAKRGEEDEFAWGLDRFADEARTLAKFNHPSIVPVTDIFEANGTAYMVMPYQEGESLDERLVRDGTLPEPELRKIFNLLIDALTLVHAGDILHRDIKPANIYIRTDGTPVLLDFGNARQALSTKSRSLTATLTPGYAPNEQYTTRGKQGAWTDVYSLGATLYKAAVGNMPPEAPERAMEDSYVPAATAAKGKYAPALLAAIDKSLSFKPGDRPQDMAAFKRLLDQPKSADETAPPPRQEAANATLLVQERQSTKTAPPPKQKATDATLLAQERQSTDRRPLIAGLKWAMAALLVTAIVGGSYWGWTRYQEIERQQNEVAQVKRQAVAAAEANQKAAAAEAKRQAAAAAQAKRKAAAAAEARKEATAIRSRGITYTKKGQLKRAIAEFDNAIRIDPSYAKAHNSRGYAYLLLKQYRRAIVDLNQAIRLSPKYVTAYGNRGYVYHQLIQYRRAIKDFNEALRIDPRHALSYLNRGSAYANLNQHRRAILDYNEALRIDPRHALSYLNRGSAYANLNQYRRAIQDYNEALRLNPRYALVYAERGYAYDRLGQTKSAISDFLKALEIDPSSKISKSVRRNLQALLRKAEKARQHKGNEAEAEQ